MAGGYIAIAIAVAIVLAIAIAIAIAIDGVDGCTYFMETLGL